MSRLRRVGCGAKVAAAGFQASRILASLSPSADRIDFIFPSFRASTKKIFPLPITAPYVTLGFGSGNPRKPTSGN
jgi:hypothetical protein